MRAIPLAFLAGSPLVARAGHQGARDHGGREPDEMGAGLEVLLIDGLGKDLEDSLVLKDSESLGNATREILQQSRPKFFPAADQAPETNFHRRERLPLIG